MKLRSLMIGVLCGALSVTMLTGCQPEEQSPTAAEYPVTAGGTIIEQRPTAVASLAPATTDMLMQLGLRGRVYALGDYCTPPAEPGDPDYYEYPRAGTPQLPDLEVLKETGVQVVFTVAPLPDSLMTELQQMNVDVVVVPPAASFDGIRENYRTIFKVMCGEESGSQLADAYLTEFDRRLADIEARVAVGSDRFLTEGNPRSAVYVASDVLTIATGDTFEGLVLETMGLVNWGADYTNYRYPKEKELELNPDIIFYNGLMNKEAIAGSSCYKTTNAGKGGKIFYLDPENLERQSPDLLDTLWQLGARLYPEEFVRDEPGPAWESPEYSTYTNDPPADAPQDPQEGGEAQQAEPETAPADPSDQSAPQ